MDRLVVVKWGGSLGARPHGGSGQADLAAGVLGLLAAGYRPLLVHGGGPEITRLSQRLGLEARFDQGMRVTDEPTLEAVIMALAGTVSTRLVASLVQTGVPAVGLSGVDGGLLRARPADPAGRLGLVGEVGAVDATPLEALFTAGLVPVVAPLALGPAGPLNVNADLAAAELAGQMAAGHLVLLTDVNGVVVEGALRQRVRISEVDGLVAAGQVQGGMIPKLDACRRAVAAGVGRAHILPGAAVLHLAAVLTGEAPEHLKGTVIATEEGGEAHVA